MQELATARAADVNRNPSCDDVCLFELALWGPPENPNAILHEMRPAFSAGGFLMPPFRRNNMLILDAGMALPPCGGYVENVGRNQYIDGCSASLLVMPPHKGDPCVNHLHIVAGTVQTEHHHPSDRIGMVVRGRGLAHHESGHPMILYPGKAWKIPAGERHHFETAEQPLDVLVFHPDSAWGPTDDAHQMLDATII